MPNWCFNELTITGNKESLQEFKIKVKGINTDICLNNFVPMPEELVDTISPREKPNWYDWRLHNWGTKWDIDAHLVEESENMLIYEFESPWGPPGNWLRKVSLMFPWLSFELYYKEPGMCFQGTMVAKESIFIDQEEDYYEELDESELEDEEEYI